MAARIHALAICLAGCHFSAGPAQDDAPTGAEPAPAGPGYHKVITVIGIGSTTISDFPMWVDVVDADLAAHASAAGNDIYFTAIDGAKLDFELERWNASTGELAAWVHVPMLAASTKLVLQYGGSAAPPPNAAAVFAGYAAVWHMSDPMTTPTVVDSTGQRNGTAEGLGKDAQVVGKLAGGLAFPGGDSDQIVFANPLIGNTPHTISAWIKQDAAGSGAFDSVIEMGEVQQSGSRFVDSRFTAGGVAVGFFNNDWTNTHVTVVGAGWTLIHWVYDGQRQSELYVNGLSSGGFMHQTGVDTTGAMGVIGNGPPQLGPNVGFPGILDEVRIAPMVLKPDRIAAEFANQSEPSHFYTVGPEQ